jgi:hypothetical protein
VLDKVWPKTNGRLTCREVAANVFHDGSDGSLGDAVKLMYMRRAARLVHQRVVQEFSELLGKKLSGVIGMERADHSHWLGFA